MAVYFANKIAARATGKTAPLSLAWSRTVPAHVSTDRSKDRSGHAPLVAVAFESGAIGVYTGGC